MQQRSLFPDGFEVQAQALSALRELRVGKALALVRRARAIDGTLVGIGPLQRALEWLAARVADEPSLDGALRAFRELPDAASAGVLDGNAAGLVETGLASWLAPHLPECPGFLDDEQLVPSSRLLLLRGDARGARDAAAGLLGAGHGDRAAVWFDHAEASQACDRRDEANASYVRALLLGPREGHAHRCRWEPLAVVWRALSAAAGHDRAAADLLLAEAWIAGAVTIPPGNTWLTGAQRALVRERSEESAPWRFSLLVYLDRSAPAGRCDVDSREEMAALLPDVLARFVAAVARRQG